MIPDTLDGVLDVPREIVRTVEDKMIEIDGYPIHGEQVRKAMRALIALGWDGWPT